MPGKRGMEKSSTNKLPPGAAHGSFPEGRRPGGHVAQAKGHGDHIKDAVLKRQGDPVCGDERVKAPGLSLTHHGHGEVRAEHFRVGTGRLNGLGEITAAGGEVENAPWDELAMRFAVVRRQRQSMPRLKTWFAST
jgi:hypothetical protein